MPNPRWEPLWRNVGFKPPGHVALSELGQYAATVRRHGTSAGAAEFPRIATHLAAGCEDCAQALSELMDLLIQDEFAADFTGEQPRETSARHTTEPHADLTSWLDAILARVSSVPGSATRVAAVMVIFGIIAFVALQSHPSPSVKRLDSGSDVRIVPIVRATPPADALLNHPGQDASPPLAVGSPATEASATTTLAEDLAAPDRSGLVESPETNDPASVPVRVPTAQQLAAAATTSPTDPIELTAMSDAGEDHATTSDGDATPTEDAPVIVSPPERDQRVPASERLGIRPPVVSGSATSQPTPTPSPSPGIHIPISITVH